MSPIRFFFLQIRPIMPLAVLLPALLTSEAVISSPSFADAETLSPKEKLSRSIAETKEIYEKWRELQQQRGDSQNSSHKAKSDSPKKHKLNKQFHQLEKRLQALFRSLFPIDYIAGLALGRYWPQISQDKREEFKKNFASIFHSKFVNLKDATQRQKVEKGESIFYKLKIQRQDRYYDRLFRKQKVPRVHGIVPKRELDINVDFLFVQKEGRWMIYDMILDGNSLVNDYRNQFHKIIRQKGLQGFLALVQKKAEQIRAPQKSHKGK